MVAVGALMCCFTLVSFKCGHAAKWLLLIPCKIVCWHGDPHAPCKNLVSFAAFVLGIMQFATLLELLVSQGLVLSLLVVEVDLLLRSKCHSLLVWFLLPFSTNLLL